MSAPKVFISYSHDSSAHKQWVAELAARLRRAGVDAVLDQWDLGLGDDATLFMEKGLSEAERVVVVCTDEYVRKADAGEGGVGYERMIVTGELVQNIGTNKFIPVIRESSSGPQKPRCLATRVHVDFRDDSAFVGSLESLLRAIHDAPKLERPPLGANPFPKAAKRLAELPTLPSELGNAGKVHELALELARNEDILGWRQLLKRLQPQIVKGLAAWRERHGKERFEKPEALHAAVDEAIDALSPMLMIALVGVESGHPRLRDQRGLMDDILNVGGWNRSGTTVVDELPATLGYVFHGLHGATCMSAGHLSVAVDFATMTVRTPHSRETEELWNRHDLVGWPKTLGGHCVDAWKYLASSAGRWPWLLELFSDELNFRAALCAYFIALNVMELASFLASGGATSLHESHRLALDVPLAFVSERQEVRVRALRILEQQGASLALLWERYKVSRADMHDYWSHWLRVCNGWISEVFSYVIVDESLPHRGLFA